MGNPLELTRSSPSACDATAEFHSLAGRLVVRGPSPNDQALGMAIGFLWETPIETQIYYDP